MRAWLVSHAPLSAPKNNELTATTKQANGITDAACVVCFFSPAYKASANCRSELTMAHELKKPVIFVKVDDAYAGDGWLKFIMGAALWEDASHVDIERFAADVLHRIHSLLAGGSKVTALAPTVSTPARAASGGNGDQSAEVAALKDSIAKLDATVGKQTQAIAELKVTVEMLVRKLDT